MKTALLVIDVQNDFCLGGALEVTGGANIVPLINAVMSRYEIICLTQDWHPPDHSSFAKNHPGKLPFESIELNYGEQVLWPDHCVQGSKGAEFHPQLNTVPADIIVRKGFNKAVDSYSAFFENDRTTPTGLDGYLKAREVENLHLVGLATDFCVAFSSLDAVTLGYKVNVLERATKAIDVDGSLALARKKMVAAGVILEH